jgi:hypothetical protein
MRHRDWIGLLAILMNLQLAVGEEFQIQPLTDDELSVLQSIQESHILETVSYLASDAMNGRDTPSKELEAASGYVTERLRAAGLEGLGPEASFLQPAELNQTLVPESTASLRIGSADVVPLTVLTGTRDTITVTGIVDNSATNGNSSGVDGGKSIVTMDELLLPPQAVDNPGTALIAYVRQTAPLVRNGAKVVLVRVAPESVLFDVAMSLRENPVTIPPPFEPRCAILLVPRTQPLDGEVSLEIPANVQKATQVHNVIGVLRGSDAELSKQAVLVSAHLDHIGPAVRGADKVNNGADDNASGVTGVLFLADACAALKQRPQRSIVFMTFWGEEKGLLGSKYFVENPLWDLESIVCNINLEMIGRPEVHAEGKAWGTGWSHSSLGPQMAAGASRVGVSIFEHNKFSEMLYTRSDNASFVAEGVIAHSFSAGSLHNDYHQPTDEVGKLNIPHMTKVIQGLLAGMLPIARGEQTPVAVPQEK